jgi:hypothetical protein
MIYLVQIGIYCHLKIHFKNVCSTHIRFLYIWILKFANFGLVDYFLLNLQDQDRIKDLNLNLKIKSGSGLTGG